MRDSLPTHSLTAALQWLRNQGCVPAISWRGTRQAGEWRVHINQCGNFWEDSADVRLAVARAFLKWDHAGRPLDGLAERQKGDR